MQQSQTILNYLNGNYLLTSSTKNQILTLEFDSQYYNPCYYFLHYQLYNHLNSTRPLLIIDLESDFIQLWQNAYSSVEFLEKNGFKKSMNNIYFINKEDSLNNILKQILVDNMKSIDNWIRISSIINFQYDKRNIQITFQILNFKHKELKTVLSITNCRMIIEQLIEKRILNLQFIDYNGFKKVKWAFFSQKLYDRWQRVVKKQIKNQQNKKRRDDKLDVTKKIGATFNLNLSQEQKLMKNEIDNQIKQILIKKLLQKKMHH